MIPRVEIQGRSGPGAACMPCFSVMQPDPSYLSFAKIKSGRYGTELQTATMSVKLVDQRFIG